MTQCQRIIEYIEHYGSITPLEAFRDLGITKLATRISELKREGYTFQQEYMKCKNRYGEDVHYMKYSFPKEVEE